MQKEVFIGEHLDAYRNDPLIEEALDGRVLLNYDEFMDWFKPPSIRMTASRATHGPRKLVRQLSNELATNTSNSILQSMAQSVCEKKIGENYGKKAINRLKTSTFDILVLLESDYEEVKRNAEHVTTKTGANYKMNCVLGFVIAEKGECERFPDYYTINLICVRSNVKVRQSDVDYYRNKQRRKSRLAVEEDEDFGDDESSVLPEHGIKPRGSILLGAYLHCTKHLGQEFGLLELAGGYTNINAFFSYSRMGFVKDFFLFGDECFKDYNNLPMSCDLVQWTNKEIIELASGKKRIPHIDDSTGLITLIPETNVPDQVAMLQRGFQMRVAIYCNILYQFPFIWDKTFQLQSASHSIQLKLIESADEYFDEINIEPSALDYLQFFERKKRENIVLFEESKYANLRKDGVSASTDSRTSSKSSSRLSSLTASSLAESSFKSTPSRNEIRQPSPLKPPSKKTVKAKTPSPIKKQKRATTLKAIGDVSNRLSKFAFPFRF